MTIQNINIGNIANDGTGDDLREAFRKVNENFDELDLRSPESTTAANIGSGVGVFNGKVGDQLQFNNLLAGNKISVQAVAGNNIEIRTDLAGVVYVTDAGGSTITDGATLRIQGGPGITTAMVGGTITIQSDVAGGAITDGFDYGLIEGQIDNAIDYITQVQDIDYGPIDNPYTWTSDFGSIT